jgi:hypothetical protein
VPPLPPSFAGEEWFAQYTAGIPDFPQAVKDFNVQDFLHGLGYTLGRRQDINQFWHPPGYR